MLHCATAIRAVLAVLIVSVASGFVPTPCHPAVQARSLGRFDIGQPRSTPQRHRRLGRVSSSASSGRRSLQMALSGEVVAAGLVVAGAGTVVASRGLSALAAAFRLADYRTTSGHDLRLDETLRRSRRQLVPLSDTPSTLRARGASVEGGVPTSELDADMDWREEIRQASQLPEVGTAPRVIASQEGNQDRAAGNSKGGGDLNAT